MKSIAYGEILWDIINDIPHLGGAPLNFAAHLSKSGAESFIISKVGNDKLGKTAVEKVGEQGVSIDFISEDSHYPTGTVDVFLVDGQPDYLIHENVAFDNIESESRMDSLDGYDLFYFGTLIQRTATSRETLYSILETNTFEYIFYDVNLRKNCFSEENIRRSLQYANIVKLNGDELEVISEMMYEEKKVMNDFLEIYSNDYNIKTTIVTDGANGCYVYENNALNHVEGVEVEVKDAIGAGDSFSAAFMYRYFKTRDAYHSAEIANRVGAYVASQQGAIPEYSEELKGMLAE